MDSTGWWQEVLTKDRYNHRVVRGWDEGQKGQQAAILPQALTV